MAKPPKWSLTNSQRRLTSSLLFFTGILVGSLFTYFSVSYAGFWTSLSNSIEPSNTPPQFAPEISTKTIVFTRNQALMDRPDAKNDLAWDELVPIGHGFVNISNPKAYGLLPGIPTNSGVDRYSVAMYHQLHCLGLLRHQYWQLIEGMSTPSSDAIRQAAVVKILRDYHGQHCFAYIAESIMCSGDMTIEWAKVEKDGTRKQVDGWGIPHQCKDPEAIRSWMESNHGPIKSGDVHLHQ